MNSNDFWNGIIAEHAASQLRTTKAVTQRHCLACREDVAPDQTECPFCDGDAITLDELADRAERQEQDRYEAFHDGGSSFHTLDEQHRAAWEQKQSLCFGNYEYRDKSGCQYCDGYCHGGCREPSHDVKQAFAAEKGE